MLRIPSQQKAFKPGKPSAARRSATAPSQASQVSKATAASQPSPLSSQPATQPTASAPTTQDDPSTQTASQPSMPPPTIPPIQTPATTQSDDLPPSITRSSQIPSSQIDPRIIAESEALARQRQTSAAPSTTASTARAGRPVLIQAAAARSAAGEPGKKSKGRIPSRSAASNSARAASSTPGPSARAASGASRSSAVASGAEPPRLATVDEVSSDIPAFLPPASPRPSTSNGLPPMIATSSASSAQPSGRGARRTASRAAPQTAAEKRRKAPVAPKTAQRRAPRRQNARRVDEPATGNGDADEDQPEDSTAHAGSSTGPGTQRAAGRKRKAPEAVPIRRPTRVRRRAYLGPDGADQPVQSQLEISQKRGAYQSRGVHGTTTDGRLTQNKKRKEATGVPKSIPELSEVNAGDHVGDEVDIERTKMGALATRVTVGKVSARGLVLHEHHKEITKSKDRERPKRIENAWRRKQVQRRKLRAERNAERAERKRRFEEMGTDSVDVVSDDEEDSEEEYEDDPEWFRNLDDEEDIRRGRQAREQNGERDRENGGDDPMEGNQDDDAAEEDDPDADARSGEDEHDAALRASGFIVTQDRPRRDVDDDERDEDEDEDEDNEDREDDLDSRAGVDYDLEAYRREVEERRRRNLERVLGQGVVEENDELKMVNSASYGRKQASERWTPEDTDMFYVALAEVGPTPLYLNEYFRGRTHRQLKNKLNREAELDPIRFSAALTKRRRPDTAFLNQNRGIDLHSPHEAETELFESAALGKINAKRRDLGLPDEEPQNEVPMAEDVMPDADQEEDDQ